MRRSGKKPKAEEYRCKNCNSRLAPHYDYELETDLDGHDVYQYSGTINAYGYRRQNAFCSLECGYRFGLRCVSAGVTLQRFEPVRKQQPSKAAKGRS